MKHSVYFLENKGSITKLYFHYRNMNNVFQKIFNNVVKYIDYLYETCASGCIKVKHKSLTAFFRTMGL